MLHKSSVFAIADGAEVPDNRWLHVGRRAMKNLTQILHAGWSSLELAGVGTGQSSHLR